MDDTLGKQILEKLVSIEKRIENLETQFFGRFNESEKPLSQEEFEKLFKKAIKVVTEYDRASASLLQRRLNIGYANAVKLIDRMEAEGCVSKAEGSKPRDVLIGKN